MKVIDLQRESPTLRDVIDLARHEAISLVADNGDEIYVTRLGAESVVAGATKSAGVQPLTQEEVTEAIEEELAKLEGRTTDGDQKQN